MEDSLAIYKQCGIEWFTKEMNTTALHPDNGSGNRVEFIHADRTGIDYLWNGLLRHHGWKYDDWTVFSPPDDCIFDQDV